MTQYLFLILYDRLNRGSYSNLIKTYGLAVLLKGYFHSVYQKLLYFTRLAEFYRAKLDFTGVQSDQRTITIPIIIAPSVTKTPEASEVSPYYR